MNPISVFLVVNPVMPRKAGPWRSVRYQACLVSKGGGTVMYRSEAMPTRESAEWKARKFLSTKRGSHLVWGE